MGTARDRVVVKTSEESLERQEEIVAIGDKEMTCEQAEAMSPHKPKEQTDPSLIKKSTPNPKIH